MRIASNPLATPISVLTFYPVSCQTITDYRGLIAAQYPGDSTAGSLVRLLMEQRSPVVVTIHPLIELHSTPLWYPEVSSELTPFKIQRISSSNVTDEIQQAALQEYTLTYSKSTFRIYLKKRSTVLTDKRRETEPRHTQC